MRKLGVSSMKELMAYGHWSESYNLVCGWKELDHEHWELYQECWIYFQMYKGIY